MAVMLAVITTASVTVGKCWFRHWFNPLSIYSALWGLCLFNYELRLIQYETISRLAWAYILIAWVNLFIGAGVVVLLAPTAHSLESVKFRVCMKRLRNIIVMLTLIGIAGLLSQLLAIQHQFGNPLVALIANASEVYGARTANELSGLSYAGAISFAACALAGVYTARLGRFSLVAAAPLSIMALQMVSVMGRTGLGMAAVLFVSSLVYTPRNVKFTIPRWQKACGCAVAIVLIGSFILVSSIRHLNVNFPGITPSMENVSEVVPFFPSIYSNFSATPVAFSLYLDSPQEKTSTAWGTYTFAPVLRLLSRLGFRTTVPPYEENYYTPVPMNTSTYLKNIHSDFGVSGIVIFPLILGLAAALLIVQSQQSPSIIGIILLANLFVIIVFAFAFDFMLLGDWYISTAVGLASAALARRPSVGIA